MFCQRYITLINEAKQNTNKSLKHIKILEDKLNEAIVNNESEDEWINNCTKTLDVIGSCHEGQKNNLSELVYGLKKKRQERILYTFPFDLITVEEVEHNIVITINDIPPLRGRVGNKTFNRWRNMVSCAIKDYYNNNVPVRESIFVWFEIYMKNPNTDIDNYTLRALTNGIVISGLIDDDNVLRYAFGFKGIKSSKEFTKIIIT